MSRVVAVVPLYPPQSRVGAWLATHELLAGLVRRGHDVVVYRRLSRSNQYMLDGIDVRPGYWLEPIDFSISHADVVISHCGDDGMAPYLATRHGVPSVRMVHGHHLDIADRLTGSALAVFNSNTLAADADWPGPQIVIPPAVRADARATPGKRVTLVNLSHAKGGSLFWELARRMRSTRFLGVKGGWGIQPVYRRTNVEVLATVRNMARVYGQTRILLMPSLHETYGLVGVEALSCGIPVIAHPTPGLRESLGGAGIFADRNDPDAWVEAITALAAPTAWAEASARATARFAELDPAADLERFATAIESLTTVGAA